MAHLIAPALALCASQVLAATAPTAAPRDAELVALATRDTAGAASTPFDVALGHYEAGRFAQAYALFAELADCGHREAARIALQMRRFGPELYGEVFEASPSRLARWLGTLSADALAGPGSCTAA